MATSGSFHTSGYDGRYLTFAWSVTGQSIENNTTTISWTLTGAGGNVYNYYQARNIKVTIDGVTVYYQGAGSSSNYINLNAGTVVASGTNTFGHYDDGTRTFSVYVEAGIYNWSVNCTGSGTFALDPIQRRSVVSGSNGTLGSANTLTLTRYNSAFTDTITATCGTSSVTIATGNTSGSVTWTPPIEWASQNVSATSVTATISCRTYSGSALLGETSTTLTFAIPESVVPTVSLTVSDATSYRATYGSYIQNKSRAWVTAAGAGVYGSTIKSYAIVCGSLSGTGSSGTFQLPNSGTVTITVTATDSRGRSASASTTIAVTAYNAPTAEITSRYRCDANGNEDYLGTYAIAFFKAAVTSLGGKNSAYYALKYRVRGTTAWTSISMSALAGNFAPSGVSQIFPAGIDNSYDVCVAVTDNFGTIESAYRTVQMASPVMDVDRSKRSLGFFQRAVDANTVAFGLPVKFNSDVNMNSQKLSGLNTPTENDQAVPLGYANQNFAPAGFGLGTYAQFVSSPDEAVNSGFYRTSVVPPLGLSGMMAGWVVLSEPGWITQHWWYVGIHAKRDMRNGVWGEYEFVNPPMVFGVEYRTTEQFNGKAVYTQAFNAGMMVDGSYVGYPVYSTKRIIRGHAVLANGTHLPFCSYDPPNSYFAYVDFAAGEMWMRCGSAHAGYVCYAQIWYIKENAE